MDPAPPNQLKPGDRIGGCVIESFIASGGMAAVYRAHKSILERTVALKVLHSHLAVEAELLSRFLREAKMAAALDHPAIVKVFDVGEENGRYYIVMEFVEGRDLREVINAEGPLGNRSALRIGRQAAEALSYAHEQGVVHRDIKPANIILTESDEVKVADFGLARPLQQEVQLTTTGQILGTPVFMSPEQCRGELLDGRSDIYSLGATLYTILSGKAPFNGETTPSLLHQVVHSRPRSLRALLPELPDTTVALVQRMMAKHPVARYQTGKEVVQAINEALASRFIVAADLGQKSGDSVFPVVPWARLALLAGTGVVLGVCAYLVWPSLSTAPAGARSVGPPQTATPSPRGVVRSRRLPPTAVSAPTPSPPTRPSPRSGTKSRRVVTDPALEARLDAFQAALASDDIRQVMPFFEPAARQKQSLLLSVTEILDAMARDGLRPMRDMTQQLGEDQASSLVEYRSADGTKAVAVPIDWVRDAGEWFVKPRTRDGGAED